MGIMKKEVQKNSMKLKNIIDLGGANRSKAVMTSRVMVATGDELMLELAGKLWELLVSTDYLRASVHGVIVEGYSHSEASEIYGDKESYLRNLVGLEGERLREDLGLDVYPYLVGEQEVENTEQIKAVIRVIEGLMDNVNMLEETVFDKLTVDIRNERVYRNTSLTDAEFLDFLRENDYMSKPKVENQLAGLDGGDVGYILYLLKTKEAYLSEKDLTRKELLEEAWWL